MNYFALTLSKKTYQIAIIDPTMDFSGVPTADNLDNTQVNILASGSSINLANLHEISRQPCIFVNGSIALTQQYDFVNPVGYVITDPRFIRHNLEILQACYQAQCPLYLTQSVLEKLAKDSPTLIEKYHQHLYAIYSVERPIKAPSTNLFAQLVRHLHKKKQSLLDVSQDSQFVIDAKGETVIGVSLDMRYGFVEAGTVAFVATQLAYTLGFKHIHLYGIDLINANEPRFYETSQNTAPSKLEPAIYNRIVPSFDLLASVYKKNGVMVYNHSPISKDLFQYLPFFTELL